MQGDRLEIQAAIEIYRGDDVSLGDMPLSLKVKQEANAGSILTARLAQSPTPLAHQESQQELRESPHCHWMRHPLPFEAAARSGVHRSRRLPGNYRLFQRVASTLQLHLGRITSRAM